MYAKVTCYIYTDSRRVRRFRWLFNITYGKCYTIHLVLLLYLNVRDLISEEPSVLVYFCDVSYIYIYIYIYYVVIQYAVEKCIEDIDQSMLFVFMQ